MSTENATDGEGVERSPSNRRRFLKGVGAATVGAVALTGTASAQQYQFEGCERVRGDTHADLAVVATDDGFECRPMTEEVPAADVPWDWSGYQYTASSDEIVVGALEESAWQGRQLFAKWACKLEVNPNACADEQYEDVRQVKTALEGSDSCGACAGRIVSGNGDGITAADAPDSTGKGGDDGDGGDGGDDTSDDGGGGDDGETPGQDDGNDSGERHDEGSDNGGPDDEESDPGERDGGDGTDDLDQSSVARVFRQYLTSRLGF